MIKEFKMKTLIVITKHAKLRIKERLGLPKRAHARHIREVIRKGTLLSRVAQQEFNLLYHGFRYAFILDETLTPVLITTYRDEIYA